MCWAGRAASSLLDLYSFGWRPPLCLASRTWRRILKPFFCFVIIGTSTPACIRARDSFSFIEEIGRTENRPCCCMLCYSEIEIGCLCRARGKDAVLWLGLAVTASQMSVGLCRARPDDGHGDSVFLFDLVCSSLGFLSFCGAHCVCSNGDVLSVLLTFFFVFVSGERLW